MKAWQAELHTASIVEWQATWLDIVAKEYELSQVRDMCRCRLVVVIRCAVQLLL